MRRFFRFSLRTLVIGVLLVASGIGLWWRWEPWVVEQSLKAKSGIIAASLSPGAREALVVDVDGQACLWEAQKAQVLWQKAAVCDAEFSSFGSWFFVQTQDTVELWRAADKTRDNAHWLLASPARRISVTSMSDGLRLLMTGPRSIDVWKLEDMEHGDKRVGDMIVYEGSGYKAPSLEIQVDDAGFVQAHFSPDGRRILAIFKHALKVFSTGSGDLLLEITDQSRSFVSAAYSPDNGRIAAASDDGQVFLLSWFNVKWRAALVEIRNSNRGGHDVSGPGQTAAFHCG